jgi:uncharacterized UPF0160 family protein
MPKRIAIPEGPFDSTTCLSVYLLRMTSDFDNAEVVPLGDPALLPSFDAAVNTGGLYDHANRRYDHRQPDLAEHFWAGDAIPLGAAGLIYFNSGKDILANILSRRGRDIGTHADYLFTTLYGRYIREIDAVSHQIPIFPPDSELIFVNHTGVSERIEMQNFEGTFEEAVQTVTIEFNSALFRIFDSDVPAIEMVKAAFEKRFEAHPGGQVLLLEVSCPYDAHLKAIETETGCQPILFVVYPRVGGGWGVSTISTGVGFQRRKSLPFPGFDKEQLERATGIEGAIFVHKAAFTSAFKTREGALAFAKLAVEAPGEGGDTAQG